MAEYEIKVYTVPEVAQMLGWPKNEAYEAIKKGTFPFPLITIGENKWLVPKGPVDSFLSGQSTPRAIRLPWQKGGRGRPAKWKKGEVVHYNIPIPMSLHERFTAVCKQLNEAIFPPLAKADWVRIALEEFIHRRALPQKK